MHFMYLNFFFASKHLKKRCALTHMAVILHAFLCYNQHSRTMAKLICKDCCWSKCSCKIWSSFPLKGTLQYECALGKEISWLFKVDQNAGFMDGRLTVGNWSEWRRRGTEKWKVRVDVRVGRISGCVSIKWWQWVMSCHVHEQDLWIYLPSH